MGSLGRGDRPVARPPPTQGSTNTVPCVGYDRTISVFERWKTACAYIARSVGLRNTDVNSLPVETLLLLLTTIIFLSHVQRKQRLLHPTEVAKPKKSPGLQPGLSQFHMKIKLSLRLTNYALRLEGVWGSGCIDPRFLDPGTSWRLVISFTPRPIYPRFQLDRRLGGPQNRCGCCGEPKIVYPTWNSNSDPSVQPVAMPAALSQLLLNCTYLCYPHYQG
jgi:hypothetical protein